MSFTDAISQMLQQQGTSKSRTAEDLQVMGKAAAMRFLDGQAENMSDAVVQTVKSASLSTQQVLRVIEFANHDTYLKEFKKEGSAHRVVDFPIADPSVVLQQLNDGRAGAAHSFPHRDDYAHPPVKTASAADVDLFAWREKTAAYVERVEDPLRQVRELREKLAHSAEQARYDLNKVERLYYEASTSLVDEVKQAATDGNSLADIVYAMSCVSPEPAFIKQAFAVVTPKLMSAGIFRTLTHIESSLQKTASAAPVDTRHPLFGAYGAFCAAISKTAELRAARTELEDAIFQLDDFAKQAANPAALAHAVESAGSPLAHAVSSLKPAAEKAVASWKATQGIFPAASEAAGQLAAPVGNVVREGVGAVAGHGKASALAGWAAHHGTKHAPELALLAGAHEAYRRPEVQRALYEANSRLNPMSQAYDERSYMLQNGMM